MRKQPGLTSLLIAFPILAYLQTLSAGFIWDDDAYVTNNPMLTSSDGWRQIWFSGHTQSQYFPLVFTVFRIQYALWGLDASGYHLVNVLLHAVNALLVWRVLDKLKLPGAWVTAALFAVHPVQVESVAWISELKNTQSTAFYLLVVLTWIDLLATDAPHRARTYGLVVAFYVLALLSKTTACTLPAALVLILWIKKQPIGWRRVVEITPFVLLGIAAGALSVWWESHLGNYKQEVGQTLNWPERVVLAGRNIWFYVSKLIWPVSLTFSYPKWQPNVRDVMHWSGVAACFLCGVCLFIARQRLSRAVLAGVIFFVAALSPLLGFIPLFTFKYTYVADHYQYVASIGLLAVAGAWLSRLPRWIPALLLGAMMVLTWRQSTIYHDPKTLWEDTLAKNPSSWMAHQNLAAHLVQGGNLEQGIAHLYEVIRINPAEVEGHYDLGTALGMSGDLDGAIVQFEQTLKLSPNHSQAHCNLGVALERKGRLEEAISHYQEALRLDPNNSEARDNLNDALGRRVKKDA